MFMLRARLLIAALWAGSLWTVGYLAAPVLFATLERPLAGIIAGNLFRAEAWVCLACAALYIGLALAARRSDSGLPKITLYLALGMALCTLLGYFALQPFMAELRAAAGPGGVMESAARTQFGVLHGISSGIYLVQSVLGAVLVVKSR
jgi:hypothetical protein